MSDMFSSDITNADSLQISAIFGFMNSEYHEAVIQRAIDSRWRRYYIEEASKGAATAGEDEDLSIESVNDAVELATERFDDKLLFQLNGKSRVVIGFIGQHQQTDAT